VNIVEFFKSKLIKVKNKSTFSAWIVAFKGLFGLRLTRRELALWKQCTGRGKAPQGEFSEFWCMAGRRAGKSFMASVVAVFLALFYDFSRYLVSGEPGVIQIVAADRQQARVIFRYISAILHGDSVLEQYIQNQTKESIQLSTGIDIEIQTCSFRSIRGRTVVCAILDEIAFWRVEGANPDREILTAIRPAMATIPNSKLIVVSSPYAKTGVLYDHFRDYHGKDHDQILVWQAATRVMNPTITQGFIDREMKKDPSAARSEYYALPREDIENFLTLEVIESLVIPGRRELPPSDELDYWGFVDPSGGRHDAFTLAIGHFDEDREKYVIDLLRAWEAPCNPEIVTGEAAEILKRYGCREVVGDRYSAAWVESAFDKAGIDYDVCPVPKSELYSSFGAYASMNKVELPDDRRLIAELRGLERRTSRSGRDQIDHGPRGSDDHANSAAGVCYLLAQEEDSGLDIRILTVGRQPGEGVETFKDDKGKKQRGFWMPLV
jgi:hypothetical protein